MITQGRRSEKFFCDCFFVSCVQMLNIVFSISFLVQSCFVQISFAERPEIGTTLMKTYAFLFDS